MELSELFFPSNTLRIGESFVIHGEAGVGKSTLTANMLNSMNGVMVAIEEGLGNLQVNRTPPVSTYAEVLDQLRAIYQHKQDGAEIGAIGIDSITAMTPLLVQHVIETKGNGSQKVIGDFPHGTGYAYLTQEMESFGKVIESMRKIGINIIIIAHSKPENINPPDSQEYTKYYPDIDKRFRNVIVNKPDVIMYVGKKSLTRLDGGVNKAVGEVERFVNLGGSNAYESKNRFGLDGNHPLEWPYLQELLATAKQNQR